MIFKRKKKKSKVVAQIIHGWDENRTGEDSNKKFDALLYHDPVVEVLTREEELDREMEADTD